ncbi:Rossmann-like domain-containing protein [Methylomagnum sp.]
MANPYEIYDLLLDYAADTTPVREVLIGLVWTGCFTESTAGLAMSPGIPTRTLPWAGTLRGKSVAELAAWVRDFEPYRATVGMAAVNAGINRLRLPAPGVTLEPHPEGGNNLAVFEHFLPEIKNRRVVVIGRYPGLDRFVAEHGLNLTVLERQPSEADLPDTAAEYLLPDAEWVFITASSIPNKTFPRLAELSRNATTVLMGPTTPWLPELSHFGIDYLAGVEIADPDVLRQTVGEGGGVRIFDAGVRYRIAPLSLAAAQEWTRQHIARTVQEKEMLKQGMADWYESGKRGRFPDYHRLEMVNVRLSRLDTCFKRLWDE